MSKHLAIFSDTYHSFTAAAKVFFPPLALAIVFPLVEVGVSLAHTVYLTMGDHGLPLILADSVVKVIIYVLLDVGFVLCVLGMVAHIPAISLFLEKRGILLKSPKGNEIPSDFEVLHILLPVLCVILALVLFLLPIVLIGCIL